MEPLKIRDISNGMIMIVQNERMAPMKLIMFSVFGRWEMEMGGRSVEVDESKQFFNNIIAVLVVSS